MVTDIHQPQLETKIAILKRKAESSGQVLDDDVTQFIAAHVVSNIRELEGALIRVVAYAHLTKQPITVELARKVIFYGKYDKKRPVGFKRVMKAIQKHFSFSFEELKSKNRNKELARARQVAMYVMKKSTDKSLREIGAYLGGRNHTTVKHALDTIEQLINKNSTLQQQIRAVEQEL
jgi:chromosomal replication initiator protein